MSKIDVNNLGLQSEALALQRKSAVLLLHGIQSDGAWQELVTPVLSWFYRPVSVKYPDFATVGPLLVLCELWIFFPGFALAALSSILPWFPRLLWLGLGLLIMLLGFSQWGISFRRTSALSKIQLDMQNIAIQRPNAIAHSFGTYLAARLLEQRAEIRFKRVLLLGCVLPNTFSWEGLHADNKVEAVRNFFSKRDWVAKLSGMFTWLYADLGAAGATGFCNPHKHLLGDPTKPCQKCKEGETAVVHDVECTHLGHSGALISRAQAAEFWLPFLWDIDAGEYRWFLDFCGKYNGAIANLDKARMAELEHEAQTVRQLWLGNATLWDHLDEKIQTTNIFYSKSEFIGRILGQIAMSVYEGQTDEFTSKACLTLHPFLAIVKARQVAKV